MYLAKDGTEIQDEAYFETIEPQTLFVIASTDAQIKTGMKIHGQHWGINLDRRMFAFLILDFQLMYEAIRNVHGNTFNTADAIRNFITENRSEFDKFVGEYQTTAKETIEKTRASQRKEHLEWFEGVPATLTTKEDVMARRSQDRIRGYFYKAKEELQKSSIYRTNNDARQLLDEMLEIFQYFLIGVDYFSALFNRKWANRHRLVIEIQSDDNVDGTKAPPRKKAKVAAIRDIVSDTTLKTNYYVSLCNELGDFQCHGIWCDDRCRYESHIINPYASRENVIIFQMWNLDHQVEITRTVIPKILSDVHDIVIDNAKCRKHKRPAKMLSIMKYFLELFTMENLRLVHIVCHDKGGHNLKSNGTVICEKCAEFIAIRKIWNKIKKSNDDDN